MKCREKGGAKNEKHLLQGVKSLELLYFKIVAKLMKNKEHLTLTGLEQIRQIKSGMNTQRKYNLFCRLHKRNCELKIISRLKFTQ
jgi:hypothetical protein